MKNLNENLFEQIVNQNKLFKQTLSLFEQYVEIVDCNGNMLFVSEKLRDTGILKNGNPEGKNFLDAFDFGSKEDNSLISILLKTKKPYLNHIREYQLNDGKNRTFLIDAYPIFENNLLAGIAVISSDINNVDNLTKKCISVKESLDNKTQNKIEKGNTTKYNFDDIIGFDESLLSEISLAKKVALNNSPVMIVGETGTGKELFAQSIHNNSSKQKGPFIAINCAAIPDSLLESTLFGTSKGAFTGSIDKPGLFEVSSNGTLFLDEINSMNIELQAKILRVLQENKIRRIGSNNEIPVNMRLISSTNCDPYEAIKNNRLRNDLFYRLAVITINIPPLRKRIKDIPILTKYFINSYNSYLGAKIQDISREVSYLFHNYPWPGNVRELKHVIEHSMNLVENKDQYICLEHLPSNLENLKNTNKFDIYSDIEITGLKNTMQKLEKQVIKKALLLNNNNITKTAQDLNISRQHLHYLIKQHKILENS